MKKILIMYLPLENKEKEVTHPYQEIPRAEEKQKVFLSSFPKTVDIYIARGEKTHVEGDTFIPQFFLENSKWTAYSGTPITADLVLGFNIPKGVESIFNTIKSIALNKAVIEELFSEYTSKSIICHNYNDIEKNFSNITTKLKVLKPQNGSRSKGVFIGDTIPAQEDFLPEHFPYLLQDFFDTSHGFYEFPGIHDFRVVMLNGQIIAKFLRQPETGKYTANSYKKGGFIDLEDWEIPESLQIVIDRIEDYCAQRFIHRYYSIDFGIGKNGEIRIFEMNSAPGLTTEKLSKTLAHYIVKNILKLS